MIIDTDSFVDVTIPRALPLKVPVFDALPAPPVPTPLTAPLSPLVYDAYGTLAQDYIDGKITDFAAFYSTIAVVHQELRLAKEEVGRKYHKARRDYLRTQGRKNAYGMPGHVMLGLEEMTVEERRELADAALKIANTHVEKSLENIEAATKAGLTSDAVRFDSHHRLQSANFQVAVAVVDAALKATVANIEQYNESLKLVDLAWDEVKNQLRWQQQQLQDFAAKLKAVDVVVENEAVYTGLLTLAYELQAIAAKQAALKYEIDLLNAQILKNDAELNVSRAEQLLAEAKGVTASLEADKAAAREGLVQVEIAKNSARIAKVNLETERVRVNADIDKAELDLSIKEKELEILRTKFEVRRKEFEAQMTEVKQALPELDRYIGELRARNMQAVSADRVAAILREASAKASASVVAAQIHYTELATLIAEKTRWAQELIAQNAEQKAQRITAAAENAANAKVESEVHYKKGT